jgi:hypothetical protein
MMVIFVGVPLVIYTPGSISFVTEVFKCYEHDTAWSGDLSNSKIRRLQLKEVNMFGALQMRETAPVGKSP